MKNPYEYVDEVRDRFLKKWIHRHSFANIEDKKKTAVSDEITFEIGYGPIGWIAEKILFKKLESIFRHRRPRQGISCKPIDEKEMRRLLTRHDRNLNTACPALRPTHLQADTCISRR